MQLLQEHKCKIWKNEIEQQHINEVVSAGEVLVVS